ncbi:MAG: hypothetical protein JW809_07235 [Pirellulales bacterium]|nr:hypothetical protein [Pirellulales bacterium]
MSESDTDRLATLIDAKHACLSDLAAMGRRQLELVREGGMTALLEVLAVKQQTIARLHQIERALDPFRNEEPEARAWRCPADRARCAERLSQCESLLAEIVAQEKEGERELVARRDETARQLQGSHDAAQARRGYLDAVPRGASRFDVTSDF